MRTTFAMADDGEFRRRQSRESGRRGSNPQTSSLEGSRATSYTTPAGRPIVVPPNSPRIDGHHGEWRSLVAHPAGGRKVAGSNPVSPISGCLRTSSRPSGARLQPPLDHSARAADKGPPLGACAGRGLRRRHWLDRGRGEQPRDGRDPREPDSGRHGDCGRPRPRRGRTRIGAGRRRRLRTRRRATARGVRARPKPSG